MATKKLIFTFIILTIGIILISGFAIGFDPAQNPKGGSQTIDAHYEDSPFGIQDLSQYDPNMIDLGARWARLSGPTGLVWDADEPSLGEFDWNRADRVINSFSEQNINLIVTILCFNKWDQEGLETQPGLVKYGLPNNLEAYKNYIKTAVKRYPQINYYQIENEPTNTWSGTSEDFAKLIKVTYLTIKEVNPNAKIVLAGIATPESFYKFYVPMFNELNRSKDSANAQYFDIIDLHWSGQFEYMDKSQGNYRTETFFHIVGPENILKTAKSKMLKSAFDKIFGGQFPHANIITKDL